MTIAKLRLEDLRKYVNQKEEFYKGVTEFVEKAVLDCGIKYEQKAGSKWILEGFHGYDIDAHFGMTTMGGNEIIVKRDGKTVLKIYYQASSDTPNVEQNQPDSWENDFEGFLEDPDQIIKDFNTTQDEKMNAVEEEAEKERSEDAERENLLERAKTLGLYSTDL